MYAVWHCSAFLALSFSLSGAADRVARLLAAVQNFAQLDGDQGEAVVAASMFSEVSAMRYRVAACAFAWVTSSLECWVTFSSVISITATQYNMRMCLKASWSQLSSSSSSSSSQLSSSTMCRLLGDSSSLPLSKQLAGKREELVTAGTEDPDNAIFKHALCAFEEYLALPDGELCSCPFLWGSVRVFSFLQADVC